MRSLSSARAPGLHVRPWSLPRSHSRRFALDAIEVPAPSHVNEADSSFAVGATDNMSPLQNHIANWIASTSMESSSNFLSISAERPPSNDEIKLLQNAFAAFYGADKDTSKAVDLLTKTIDVWEGTKQGGDEIAGLYRVRGDAYMVSTIKYVHIASTDNIAFICSFLNCETGYRRSLCNLQMQRRIMAKQLNTWMEWTEIRLIPKRDQLRGT